MNIKKILTNNLYMLKLVIKYTPKLFFWCIFYNAIRGFSLAFANVLFLKVLFNSIEKGLPFTRIAIIIGIYAAYQGLACLLYSFMWCYIQPKYEEILHSKIQPELFKKIKQMDLECYDSAEFYNDFVWAMEGADKRVISVLNDFGGLINDFISLLTVIGVLLTIDKYVILLLIISISLSIGIQFILTKMSVKREIELKPMERKSNYITRIFYLKDYATELRLSKIAVLLQDKFSNTVDEMKQAYKKHGTGIFRVSSLQNTFSVIFTEAGVILWLAYKMFVERAILMGDFTASLNSIWRVTDNLNNIVSYIARFQEHGIYGEKFIAFMEYKPKVSDRLNAQNTPKSIENIELKDVFFTYDGLDTPTINGISLKINRGEKIALVGYNGAGKSTLIKLLIRLYNVKEGEIRLNDINIKDFTVDSYRENFGCIFQDHQIYAANLSENVAMDIVDDNDTPRILSALHDSGFDNKLIKLEYGLDTPITREYNESGVNLSGGEVQKIGIARIFAKDYPIVILDEPTSALDPISEYELNKVIMEKLKDKIVVFISHRLSTTRMADKIYMLEKGRIIESGTHEELMNVNGKYAEMFNLQAEKYRIN